MCCQARARLFLFRYVLAENGPDMSWRAALNGRSIINSHADVGTFAGTLVIAGPSTVGTDEYTRTGVRLARHYRIQRGRTDHRVLTEARSLRANGRTARTQR